jgi:hypothetical protein
MVGPAYASFIGGSSAKCPFKVATEAEDSAPDGGVHDEGNRYRANNDVQRRIVR